MAPRILGALGKGAGQGKEPKGTVELKSVRDVALQRRQRLLFGKFAESQAGTTQLFPLFGTFPWHIQKHSSFLALHFTTIGLFWILLLLYCLLALYPLISTIHADNYRTEFTLRTEKNDTQPLCPGKLEKRPSPKTIILQMSVGNFCADNGFSAVEDCGTVCTTEASECPGPEQALSIVSKKTVCQDIQAKAGGDAAALNQCCWASFERAGDNSVGSAKEIPQGHFWLWGVAGMFLYSLWLIGVQQFQTVTQAAVQRKNITAADYAVFISNLNGTLGDDSKLEDFGRHYGEVVMAFHIRTLGRVLQKCNNIRDIGDKRKELRGLQLAAEERKSGRAAKGKNALRRLNRWAYTRYMCLWHSPEEAYKRAQDKWKQLQKEERELEEQELEPTGNAIIVFNDEESAQNMLWDYERRLSSNVLGKLLTPGMKRAFHVLTGGMFSKTTRIKLDLPGRTAERFVTLRRAPEPSDIWWENTRDYAWAIVRRRTFAVLGYVVLLAAAFAVQFVLGLRAEAERVERIESGSSASDINTEFFVEQVRNRVFLAGKALSTFIFSSLGSVLIQATSNYELHTTSTANVGATVTKLSIFNLMNYFIVPIVAVIALAGSADDEQESVWYRRGGFVETAFWIQLGNAFLPSMAAIIGTPRILRLHSLSRAAVTQTYADKWTDPAPFSMAFRLALGILTVGLSLLYAPILPISPFLGLVGMTVHYAADQYVALRHSLKPRAFDVEALDAVNYVLRLLPLAQVLLMLLYFPGTKTKEDEEPGEDGFDKDVPVFAPVVVGVVVWAIFALLPAHLLTRIMQQHHEKKHPSRAKRPKFLRLVRATQLQPTVADHNMTTTLAVVRDVPDKSRFVPDDYVPKLTAFSSQKWYQKVQLYMHLIDPPKPAVEQKLRHQSDATQVLPGGRVRNAAEQSRTKRLVGGNKDEDQRIVQLDAGKGDGFSVAKNEDDFATTFAPPEGGEGRQEYHTQALYTVTFDEPSSHGGPGVPPPHKDSVYRPICRPSSENGGVLQAPLSGRGTGGALLGMAFGNQRRSPSPERQAAGWGQGLIFAGTAPDSFEAGLPGHLPNATPARSASGGAPYVLPGRSPTPASQNGDDQAGKPPAYLPGKSTASAGTAANGTSPDRRAPPPPGKGAPPVAMLPSGRVSAPVLPSKAASFTPSHPPGYTPAAVPGSANAGSSAPPEAAGTPYTLPGRSAVPAGAPSQPERQSSSRPAAPVRQGTDVRPLAPSESHRRSAGGAGGGAPGTALQRSDTSSSARPAGSAVGGYVLPGRSSEPSVGRSQRGTSAAASSRKKSKAEAEEAVFAGLMASTSSQPGKAQGKAADAQAMDESAELRNLMSSIESKNKR